MADRERVKKLQHLKHLAELINQREELVLSDLSQQATNIEDETRDIQQWMDTGDHLLSSASAFGAARLSRLNAELSDIAKAAAQQRDVVRQTKGRLEMVQRRHLEGQKSLDTKEAEDHVTELIGLMRTK